MALYAFDGTWNNRKDGDHLDKNTNVVRFFDAYKQTSGTNDLYVPGIGTRFRALGKIVGGAFGLGERHRLNKAYDHLCRQWTDGDQHIDIVGFSRGAATTLDFCHMIQDRGIRAPGSDTVVEPSPQIRFVGVWDIVAAFGLGITGIPDFNFGHNMSLPKKNITFAFHGLALDERRLSFLPTRLKGACEVWFRGVHSDVGGGNGNRGLNDVTLVWMMRKAKSAGLPITLKDISALTPNPAAPPKLDGGLTLDIRHVTAVDRKHYTVADADGCRVMPATCVPETQQDEFRATEVGANGIEVLTQDFGDRFQTLIEFTEKEGQNLEMPFDDIRDAVIGMIEVRMPLVQSAADVARAQQSISRLLKSTVKHAKQHQFKLLNEFFVNEALHELWPLYPFAD